VGGEDPGKPLTDGHIADQLKRRGVTIARRTVAKYREEEKILPTRLRRKR
jgi:RNA polymerase sigma-54 factor